MELRLERAMPVEVYEAILDLARATRRDDILSVLKLADEHAGRVTAAQIVEALLIGRPLAVGETVIKRCAELGLLDPSGKLTPVGVESLRAEEVFVAERGRYRLTLTRDPLVPQRLLNVQPAQERFLWTEVTKVSRQNGSGPGNKTANEEPMRLPEWVDALAGRTFNLIGPERERVRIEKVEPKGVQVPAPSGATLRAVLRIPDRGKSTLRLEGMFKSTLEPPSIDFLTAWRELLGSRANDWAEERESTVLLADIGRGRRAARKVMDLESPVLLSSFDELSDQERMSFSRTMAFDAPSVAGLGTFEHTEVSDVPVAPRSSAHAQAWARWMLEHNLDSYVRLEQYAEVARQVRQAFQPFDVVLPDQETLAAEIRSSPRPDGLLPERFWYLQAPLDLRPLETPTEGRAQAAGGEST